MDSLSSWDIGMSCARVEPKGAEETEDGAAPPIPPHNLIHLPKGLSSLFPLFISAKREPPLCRDLPHCCPLKPNQPAPIWQRFMWRLWAGFFSLPTGRVIQNAQKWRLWMVGGKTHCRKPSQNLILLLRNFNSYVTCDMRSDASNLAAIHPPPIPGCLSQVWLAHWNFNQERLLVSTGSRLAAQRELGGKRGGTGHECTVWWRRRSGCALKYSLILVKKKDNPPFF